MRGADFKQFIAEPVEISAVQFTYHNREQLLHDIDEVHDGNGILVASYLYIETTAGRHIATVGDWIIKGVEGEVYPCKPSVFAEKYKGVQS